MEHAMKTFALEDIWFDDQPIYLTASRCPDRGIWTVTKAVQRGWDITETFRDKVYYNATFAAKFVQACEGAK